jgi:hypothetical protein
MEKSKHLQDQLRELKTEIDILKVEENDTEFDRLHEDGIQRGDSKYSTLRQVNIFKAYALQYICSLSPFQIQYGHHHRT